MVLMFVKLKPLKEAEDAKEMLSDIFITLRVLCVLSGKRLGLKVYA